MREVKQLSTDELYRLVVRKFMEKHGHEVRRIVKGDILLEAGLKKLEEVAKNRSW